MPKTQPQPAPKGKALKKPNSLGRLGRSGLTQLMVFLNGLILTITAFITLSVFINQMRNDDVYAVVNDIRYSMEKGVSLLASTLEGADRTIEMLGSMGTGQVTQGDFAKLVPLHDLFDEIYLYEKTAGGWRSAPLYVSTRIAGRRQPLQVPVSMVESVRPESVFTIRLLDGMGKLGLEDDKNKLESRPLVVMHSMLSRGDVTKVIVGVVSLGNGLQMPAALSNETVQRIIVRDGSSGARVLQMDRREAQGEPAASPFFSPRVNTEEWRTIVGDAALDVSVEIRENMRMLFVSRVPLLLLLFGISITMIGTLYVRSNYRQSLRLSAMNNALTSKNLELRNQVDESNRLYEAMQRSEREYRGVIDSVSDIIFECDSSGNVLFVNATWEKVTGYSIPHSLGRDLFDMLHPADHDQQRQAFSNLVRDRGQGYRAFTRIQTADGKYRAVDLAFSMVRTDNLRNARVVGTITDVEERRRAERALAEAEKKYRNIVENAASGIYQVNNLGRVLSANPALASILGFNSPRDVMEGLPDIGKVYTDPRDRLRYEHELETFGFIRNHEATILRRDGQIVWVSESARAVKDDDGNLLFYEGSIEDITQRKQAEQGLKEAKLHSDLANRAKSEFLANMSHELRTPLNAIIGFSEIIRNEAMGPVGMKAYADYANDINESGKKLLTIINDILDISRIEAGNRSLNETLFNIHSTVATCVSLLGSKAEAGRITVLNNLHGDLPRVIGEELAFKQMFMNLLSNAIKFTPPEGRVTIDCQFAEATQDLRISITDTGIGMDEKEIEKALSPFGQVESAFSRTNSGTGLGLTLVDALIKMHDGRFELSSRKGVGTTATVVIPARRVAVAQQVQQGSGNITLFPRTKVGD